MKWLLAGVLLLGSLAANGTVIDYRIPVLIDKFDTAVVDIGPVDNTLDDLYLSVDTATGELLSFQMSNKFFAVDWLGRTPLTYDYWKTYSDNTEAYFVFGQIIDELVFTIAFELMPIPAGENVGEWLHHQSTEGYIVITESETVSYTAFARPGEKIVVPEPSMLSLMALAALSLLMSGFLTARSPSPD